MFDPSEASPICPFGVDTFLVPLKHYLVEVAFDPFDWVAANFVGLTFEHSVVEQLVAVAAVEGTVGFASADC